MGVLVAKTAVELHGWPYTPPPYIVYDTRGLEGVGTLVVGVNWGS